MRQFGGRLVLAAAALLLVACAPAPSATPTATPPTAPLPTVAATPRPTATLAPTATATITATPDAYAGWQTVETDALTIRLPADWQAVDLMQEDIDAIFEQLKEDRPALTGIVERSGVSKEFDLVAFGPDDDGYADNLNIRRAPPVAERITDLQTQVLDYLVPQYRLLGLDPTDVSADLRTDSGLPMGRIVYTLSPAGEVPELRGTQYLVLAEDELWIMTYVTRAQRDDVAPPFEQSAMTFTPK